jgi:uncharacterized membrane protein YqgA involved in biofilm formation
MDLPLKGTLINVLTVLVGSFIGMTLGDRLPKRLKTAVLYTLGLGTILIGIKLAMLAQHIPLILAALLMGAVTGTLLDLEGRLERAAEFLKSRFARDSATFVTGFVSASLIFCVGPMTVVGSIQDGTVGDATLLYTKSILDGFAAMALSAGLGIGVMFSAVTVLILQGGLTLAGGALAQYTSDLVIGEMSATGGILILGIGLYLLDIKKLPLANLLPALAFIVPLTLIFG